MVDEARRLGRHVIDRCNLTILRAPGFTDLPEFLAEHQVEIVASLPCYLEENVDAQRGNVAFRRSIEMLQRLNALGYGRPESGLELDARLQPGRPEPSATAGGAGSGLSPRAGGAVRHRIYPAVHDHEHADQPVPRRPAASPESTTRTWRN